MPAKDKFHDVVINALKKDGWVILKEQVRIIIEDRRLWIDAKASHVVQNQVILLEVKGFDTSESDVVSLEHALGQYLLYRAIIEDIGWSEDLYLAIPRSAYDGIFSEAIGLLIRRKYGIKLIVIDAETEKILWIP